MVNINEFNVLNKQFNFVSFCSDPKVKLVSKVAITVFTTAVIWSVAVTTTPFSLGGILTLIPVAGVAFCLANYIFNGILERAENHLRGKCLSFLRDSDSPSHKFFAECFTDSSDINFGLADDREKFVQGVLAPIKDNYDILEEYIQDGKGCSKVVLEVNTRALNLRARALIIAVHLFLKGNENTQDVFETLNTELEAIYKA